MHVLRQGEVAIDAWASAADLEAQKPGETVPAANVAEAPISQERRRIEGLPKIVRVKSEVAVRAVADELSPVIGAIEIEGEVLVRETLRGWTSVLPTNRGVEPAEGRGFWVRSADLTVATK